MSDNLDAEYAALTPLGIVKRIAKQAAVYSAALWAGSAAQFVLTPINTRYLHPTGYGQFELLNSTSGIILTFLKLGMVTAVLRFYNAYPDQKDRLRVVSSAVLLVLGLGAAALVGTIIASPDISRLIFRDPKLHTDPRYALITSLAIAGGIAELGFLLPGTLLRVREQVGLYTRAAVGKFALTIVVNIVLVVVLRQGLLGAVLANTIPSVCFAIAFTWYTLSQTGIGVSREALRKMLAYGLPLTAGSIPGLIINTSDRYILNFAHDASAVGLYALATKFGMLLQRSVFEAFTFVYSMFIFRVAKTENPGRTFGLVFTYLVLAGGWPALALALLSPELVRIGGGTGFVAAASIVPVYLLGSLLFGISPMFEVGLYVKDKTIFKPFIVTVNALVALGLYMALIPRFSGLGAAWAYAAGEAAFCVALYVVGQRYLAIQFERRRLATLAAAMVGAWFVGHLVGVRWGGGGTALRAAMAVSFPLALWPLGFYSRDEVSEALRAIRALRKRLPALRPVTPVAPEPAARIAAPAATERRIGWRSHASNLVAPAAEPIIRWAGGNQVLVLRYHSVFEPGTERDQLISPTLLTAPAEFDRQMAHVAAHYNPLDVGRILTCLQESSPLPRKGVVVTFDDGYADNYEVAAPILLKHGIPAAFFIITNVIGDSYPPWHCTVRYAFERTAHDVWLLDDGTALPLTTERDRLWARRRAATLFEGLAAEERAAQVSALCAQLGVEPPRAPALMMTWSQARELALMGFTIGAHSATHPNLARISGDE
jgi:O-antigen/teichoic acid export membrane protein/peptidoglycan/xylan/chitin deacetylase (PgdA/CDA1 family)